MAVRGFRRQRRFCTLSGERGFTLPELMAAMLVFAIGAIALVSTLDTSRRVGSNSERREEAVTLAQQEVASIQSRAYAEVALSAVPAENTSDPYNPAYYVTRAGSPPYTGSWYRWDQPGLGGENPPARCTTGGTPSSNCAQFVIAAGGVSPTPTLKSVQLAQGPVQRYEVHRFVSWADDPSTAGCTQDYKRVTVAVRATGATSGARLEVGPRKPALISTLVSNPESGLLGCG